ncbi:hemolysin family protein [Flavobacteriales bacterium]|jgi:CBS domain containing-hemolysin-like protein|nr:hemolysin family protein [Flavobacteriales bacterium]MDB4052210.1 hemolysin family protein [Flavobacteriales bacterium]MDB9931927.1 hemolysin family protein [Flavobacteriales bacterium]MDG1176292.1 hemolysin family protein [Flavobacteriales bacterium]|tara:strand:+ start:74 stop:1339 length:1266 start_codon:yes stop_codon:yes gene_type:complete
MEQYILLIILVSLVFSAFFSGTEIAYLQSNRLKIEIDRKQGIVSARILSFFVRNESKFITMLLLGNNIALVVYGIFMGELIIEKIFPAHIGIQDLPWLILLTQTLISTLVILVTAEFLPKTIFRINPNRTLSLLAFLLAIVYGILYIPTMFVTFISNLILGLFGSKKEIGEVNFGAIDLDDYLNKSTKIQTDKEQDYEVKMFHNALNFNKVKARDCLIPRTEIKALNVEQSIEELKNEFVETGYSKIMIFRDTIDNIIGYVHSFEVFKSPETITEILRPVGIVAESMPVNKLLNQFIKQKQGITVVVDEYGGTAGIITMEDVVEEIFGEIEDEHDNEELIEEQHTESVYIFSGRQEIEYINSEYNLELPESDEYETLAGLIVTIHENIPNEGDIIEINDFYFEILECSNSKIEKIKLIQNN